MEKLLGSMRGQRWRGGASLHAACQSFRWPRPLHAYVFGLQLQTRPEHQSHHEAPRRSRRGDQGGAAEPLSPDAVRRVNIQRYLTDRGPGLKVTPLHYSLLPHTSKLGERQFSEAAERLADGDSPE